MTGEPGAPTITILVDNRAEQGLLSEHGFSAWVEVAGRRLLFDMGQGPALEGNADKLGIDLRAADTLGCSHAGLVNTLQHALRLSDEPRLHAVLGGFHLTEASERQVHGRHAA